MAASDPFGARAQLGPGLPDIYRLSTLGRAGTGATLGTDLGRMPVTGIPLPLMSYGGSSMMSVFAMLGLVNNVRLRRFGS